MAGGSAAAPAPMEPPPPPFTMEQRLFHRLRSQRIRNPSAKEFKEAYAFCNGVRHFLGSDFDVVLDVAGGHGALAALLLLLTRCGEAVVIDPATVAGGEEGVRRAWGDLMGDRTLRYRRE
eukprot:EG_transcript_54601